MQSFQSDVIEKKWNFLMKQMMYLKNNLSARAVEEMALIKIMNN